MCDIFMYFPPTRLLKVGDTVPLKISQTPQNRSFVHGKEGRESWKVKKGRRNGKEEGRRGRREHANK